MKTPPCPTIGRVSRRPTWTRCATHSLAFRSRYQQWQVHDGNGTMEGFTTGMALSWRSMFKYRSAVPLLPALYMLWDRHCYGSANLEHIIAYTLGIRV